MRQFFHFSGCILLFGDDFMVVYADVLIVLNLIVDYFLVLLSSKLLRVAVSVPRALFAGGIGAVSSLYIFLPQSLWIVEFFVRIAICVLMTLAAFGFGSIKKFLRGIVTLFGVTFGYAGLMMAFWYILRPDGMVINNSVVYFDISPVVLIVSTVISYFAVSVIRRVVSRNVPDADICEITVSAIGNSCTVKAIIDTGNSIEDIMGGGEVIVADKGVVTAVFGDFESQNEEISRRYRLLPCDTVSGGGMLEGYRCDKAVISVGGKSTKLCRPILAVSRSPLPQETPAIINPKVLE